MTTTATRHGSASWASEDAYLRHMQGEGAFVGYRNGRTVRFSGDGPWSIVGGSGSGKFVSQLAQIVIGLCWRNAPSMLIFDPKGELAAVCKARLEAMGCEVRCINPQGLFRKTLGQDRLNPWDLLSPGSPTYYSDAKQIVETFSDHAVSAHQPFFDQAARGAVHVLLAWGTERYGTAPNFADLHTLINTIEGDPPLFKRIAAEMAKSPIPDIARAARALVARQESAQRSHGDVMQTIYNLVGFLSDPSLVAATHNPNCTLDALFEPGKRKVYFVIIPVGKLEAWKPFFRGIFESTLVRAERTIERPRRARPWIILDEAAQIKGPLLRLFYAAGRAFVNIVTAWQATWQMGTAPEMAEMMTSSSLITLEGGGLNDGETNKYFSDLLGLQDLGDHEKQSDRAHVARQALWDFMMYDGDARETLSTAVHNFRQSQHQEHRQRPLLAPHQLREMPRQSRVALFASERPMLLSKVPYWLDRNMPALSPNPYAPKR